MADKIRIGYISRLADNNFKYSSAPYRRVMSGKFDRVYSKLFWHPYDHEEIKLNTDMMKENPGIILVTEPFFVDEKLEKKVKKWVEWANNADPSEYDPFYRKEEENA